MVFIDKIFALKKLDMFAQPVRLKTRRTKNGRAADFYIGSWLGALLSLIVVTALVFQTFLKLYDLDKDKNSYSSTQIQNKFGELKYNNGTVHANTGEIKVSDFNFLPSLETKIITDIDSFKQLGISEIFEFDAANNYKYNLANLAKYLKFYVKILKKGTAIGTEKIYRSNMILCTEQQYSALTDEVKSKADAENRLCPDMSQIKDDLILKNGYSNK